MHFPILSSTRAAWHVSRRMDVASTMVVGIFAGLLGGCTAGVDLSNADSNAGFGAEASPGSDSEKTLLCLEPAVDVRKFSEVSTVIRVTLDILGNGPLQEFTPHGCHCSYKEGTALRAVRPELTLFNTATSGAEARCEIAIGKVTAPFDLGCRVIHGMQEQRIIGLSKWYRVSPVSGDEASGDKAVVDDRGISLATLASEQTGWGEDTECGVPRTLPESGIGGSPSPEDDDSFESVFGTDEAASAAPEGPDTLDNTSSQESSNQRTSVFPVIDS